MGKWLDRRARLVAIKVLTLAKMERTLDDSAVRRKFKLMLERRLCRTQSDVIVFFVKCNNLTTSRDRHSGDDASRRCHLHELGSYSQFRNVIDINVAILLIIHLQDNVTNGLVVYPKRIQRHIQEELPFMITVRPRSLLTLHLQ